MLGTAKMSEARKKIEEKLYRRKSHEEADRLKIKSNGAVLELKRICDVMLESHLGRVNYIHEAEIALSEIKECSIQLQEYRESI